MSYTPRQWITALDLDFTAESNQTLSTDTTYTIGGKTWTKINSANDATAMAVTNGTGLVIQPASATNISTSTFSSPTLQIPLTSIIPSFNPFMSVRIWVYESASNEAANSDRMVFGAYIYNGSYNNQYTLGFFRGFGTGVNGWGGSFIALQSNVLMTTTSIPLSTNRVGVAYLVGGVLSGQSILFVGSSVVAGAWPSLSNLIIAAAPGTGSVASANFANTSSGLHAIGDVNLFLTALRNGSATSLSVTIARVRVDYLPFDN